MAWRRSKSPISENNKVTNMARKDAFPSGNRKQAPKRGRKPKQARGPFAKWIKATGKTLAEIAEMLSTNDVVFSHQSVTNLRAGHTRPSLARALIIEKVSGGAVPASSWREKTARQ